MKKISIIVPVYNVEKYIDKCLKSLVNQTIKDIEILVVNDGSPDNSQKIIDKYVKKYPELVKSFIKENGGQGSARNLALNKAKGEFISFVDSDDWLDLNVLENMYNKAKKDKLDVVICDMVDHYEDGSEQHFNCTIFQTPYEVTPSACNKIFRRKIIGDIRFPGREWYEDFDFTTKILLNDPKIGIVSDGCYHCHARKISTMSNNNSLKNLDMITVLEDIKEYAKKTNTYDDNIISYLIFSHVLVTSINRVNHQKNKDVKYVLKTFNDYCRKNIKNYRKKDFYNKIDRNRKIIAFLNYHKLYGISKLLLDVKNKIR